MFICACFIITVLFYIIIGYFQINTILIGIKDSVFSIAQNAIIAYDKEALPLDTYKLDKEKLKYIMQELLYKNHIEGKSKIQDIQIKELSLIQNKMQCIVHTKGRIEDTFLHVKLEITFMPIINIGSISTVTIHEDVKLALMKY